MFEFWIKNEKKNIDMLLPVTPQSYEASYGKKIEVVNSVSYGDINLIGNKKPENLTLSKFFSVKDETYVNNAMGFSHAMDYVNTIKRWIDGNDIVRVIIANENVTRVNGLYRIEDITYSENDKSDEDIDYTINLKEYINLSQNKVSHSDAKVMARPDTKIIIPSKYTVRSGDNLSKIARKLYGDASKWKYIYEKNKNVIGKNPNLIRVGQELIYD